MIQAHIGEGKKKKNVDINSLPIYALEDPESYGLNEKQTIALWQRGIDRGEVFGLQGWYGRTAMSLIEQGICHKPKKKTNSNSHDYYGNRMW